MELYEFTSMLKELSDYYERAKEPKNSTTELWFDNIRKIPSEPIKWIVRKIEEENDSFPRNFPSAVWGAYREWMQANPNRVASKTYFDCPDCTEGLIWARQDKYGCRYTYVFRCARCKQSTLQAYPIAVRMELKADYDLVPKAGDPYCGARRLRNVRGMVAGIGCE